MCYLCKEKVTDYSHFYGQVGTREITSLHANCFAQGGTATATKKCPLWSDNKALHEIEVAGAAEEARKMLAKDNIKLDVDPLKGIAAAPAMETAETVRAELFRRWENVLSGVNELPNVKARRHFAMKGDQILNKFQKEDVVEQKTFLLAKLDWLNAWVAHCQQHPAYEPAQVRPASEVPSHCNS
jgi:hypothetical protein